MSIQDRELHKITNGIVQYKHVHVWRSKMKYLYNTRRSSINSVGPKKKYIYNIKKTPRINMLAKEEVHMQH